MNLRSTSSRLVGERAAQPPSAVYAGHTCAARTAQQLGFDSIIQRVLRIGKLQFDFPVIQAALSGYSDAPMRVIARRHGAPLCLHEVVLDKLVLNPGKLRPRILALDPEDHPVGGQIMGADAEQFARAALAMVDAGFDLIDINFGCPVKKVLGRRRGGFLLSEPGAAIKIIKCVRDAVPPDVPVTLKMRSGMDASPASERNFFHILDAAFDAALDAVTVHPRTVKQRYVGPSDWEFLTRVKRRAGDKIILGSGDLYTAGDIRRMFEQTGVDGATAARGCIGNPWIFHETRALLDDGRTLDPPSVVSQGRVIREHFSLSAMAYGEKHAARVMRKFGIKYAELHPDYLAVRDAFVAVRGAADWFMVLDKWYDPQRVWSPGRRKTGPDHLVAAGAEP